MTIGEKEQYEIPISHNIKNHLLQNKESKLISKFEHAYSESWKTSELQLVKLFEIDLGGEDPFYIEGQDEVRN